MQEIEVIETPSEKLRLIELVPELRSRYFATFVPMLDPKVLNRLAETLIIKLRLGTRSQLAEINVNNALSALEYVGFRYSVGVNPDETEEHLVTVPFRVNAQMIINGRRAYDTMIPSGHLFRATYIDVEYPYASGTIKHFALSEMSDSQANDIWSWSISKIDEQIISITEKWVTYENKPSVPEQSVTADSEYLRIAKELQEITGRSFIVPHKIFYFAMSLVGYDKFIDAIILGKDTEEMLNALRYEISVKDSISRAKRKVAESTYEKSIFMHYASQRLSAEKYKKLLLQVSDEMSLDGIAKLLDTSDVAMIKKTIADEQKKVDALANNKCPHRRLVAELASDVIAEDKIHTLKELNDYIPAQDVGTDISQQELITCVKCKFPLMCPHELIMQRDMAAKKSMRDIKENISAYIYPDQIQGNFVCRVCGQVIVSISAFDAVIDQFEFSRTTEDPEVSALWSEVSYMTKYIAFKNLVNRNSFINAIVSLIWPLIQTRTSQIMNSRGSSTEEIVAKKRINNAVYILAAFINLSVVSASNAGSKDVVGVALAYPDNTQGKDHTAKMFNFAANIIGDTMSIFIRRVPGMTLKMIAQDLVVAYRSIAEKRKGPIVQVYDESGNTDTWLNSSWFDYMCLHMLDKISKDSVSQFLDKIAPYVEIAQEQKKKSKTEDKSEGKPESKSRKVLKARKVDYSVLRLGSFKLALPNQTPESILKKQMPVYNKPIPRDIILEGHPLLETFREWWDKYYYQSFVFTVEFMRDFYPKIGYEGGQETSALAELHRSPQKRNLNKYETLLLRVIRYINMKYCHPMPDKGRYTTQTTSPLGYIYTSSGIKRDWNQYGPWKRPAGKKGPWIRDEKSDFVYKWPPNAENAWSDSTGYKYGDVISTDVEIIAAIKANEKITNLIEFYEFICPKGDLHTFEAKKCSKCGYLQGNKSSDDQKKYYDTYQKDYLRDQKIITGEIAPTQIPQTAHLSIKPKKPVTIKPLDYNLVIEAAKFCKVQPNMIASIGAYEGAQLKAIQDNKYTAPVTTAKIQSRPDKIRTCCMHLIIKYGSFVNIAHNYNPSTDLVKLLEDIRVPKGIMSLEQFSDAFMEKYDTVFMNNSSKELVDFALGAFVDMLLKLRDIQRDHKTVEPVIEWILSEVLGSERLYTKANITNWSMVLKTQQEIGDMNTDEYIQPGEEEDEDTEEANYGDSLDLEGDDEKTMDGDEGNQIKVRGHSLD